MRVAGVAWCAASSLQAQPALCAPGAADLCHVDKNRITFYRVPQKPHTLHARHPGRERRPCCFRGRGGEEEGKRMSELLLVDSLSFLVASNLAPPTPTPTAASHRVTHAWTRRRAVARTAPLRRCYICIHGILCMLYPRRRGAPWREGRRAARHCAVRWQWRRAPAFRGPAMKGAPPRWPCFSWPCFSWPWHERAMKS